MASIPAKRVDHKVQRQVDPFIVYGIDAAGQAIEDAGLTEMDEATKLRAGVSIGSGIGGLPGIESESLAARRKRTGPRQPALRPRPPHQPRSRDRSSIKYGLMGPNHAVVTACSTGAHSIGDAARMIKDDDADIMLAGGAEATICPIGIAGFAQARALNMTYQRPARRRRAALTTRTATASSWARARAWSCSRNMSMPKHAARKSMRRSSATAFPAMRITSPRRIRKDRAPTVRCKWR